MQFYQMDAAKAALELNTDVKNGRVEAFEKQETGFVRRFLNLLSQTDFLQRPEFLIANILCLVCFVIAVIFSLLNRLWPLFRLTLASGCIIVILYIVEKIILAWYRKNYFDRIRLGFQQVTVIRGGKKKRVRPDDLCLGDLLYLEEGDILYGDARIISCENLYADEKHVFSKTIPSAKSFEAISINNLSADQQNNMLWKGSYITSGRCQCVLTALGEDCYIEKTGGRKGKKQRSLFYNKQNNISHMAVYAYILMTVALFLLSAFITGRYVETFLEISVTLSLVLLNPISSLIEWTYYRCAKNLADKGVLIRNIEAFDGMNREKDLYFDAEKLVEGHLSFSSVETFVGSEKDGLFYFSLCTGDQAISAAIQASLNQYCDEFKELKRSISGIRLEKDLSGNLCGAFLNGERAVATAAGYWKNMIPLLKNMDESVLEHIHSLEKQGKMIWLVGASFADFIPAHLNFARSNTKLSLVSLFVFDVNMDDAEVSIIKQLHHASARVHLYSRYSDVFTKKLADLYELDSIMSETPNHSCYSLPHIKDQTLVADQRSSLIEKERANLVLNDVVSPHRVIHLVKCMFCGIRRATNYLGVIGILTVLTAFVLLLHKASIMAVVLPMLIMRIIAILPCYALIVGTRNCNQHKRSLLLGAFCGLLGLLASFLNDESALLVIQISSVFLSIYLLIRRQNIRAVSKHEIVFIFVVLLIAVLSWLFIEVNWLLVILLALFVPLAALLLDLFY